MQHIFLIGYRGAGKTTIGRMLAKTLDRDFVDTDQLVCRNSGQEIATIVAQEGWDGFRRREAQALGEAAAGSGRVVATGGGAVLHRQVWQQIGKKVFVVWLHADIAILAERLKPSDAAGEVRPSLTGRDIRDEIVDVLAERLPLYQDLADLTVDTGTSRAEEIVKIIIDAYRQRYGEGEY